VSTLLYIVADSVAWLFAARALQGLATGVALSTTSAAMLDFQPRRDPNATGTMNAVMTSAGAVVGVLISSALVQAGTAPRVLPYVVVIVLFAGAFAGAAYLPEPVAAHSHFRLTPQKPHVPPEARRAFLLAALAVLGSWSITGLSYSLGPQLSSLLFGSTNAVVSSLGIVMIAGTAVLVVFPSQRLSPRAATAIGSASLAAGMVLIVLAATWSSSSYFIAGSILAGVGFGGAFLSGLRGLVTVIPGSSRGAVMAAFYIVAYFSVSFPPIIAGLVVPHLGLRTTFEIFGSIVAGIAVVVTEEAIRSRSGSRAPPCPTFFRPPRQRPRRPLPKHRGCPAYTPSTQLSRSLT
jgi:MFS family permease